MAEKQSAIVHGNDVADATVGETYPVEAAVALPTVRRSQYLSKLIPKSSIGLTAIVIMVATIDSINLGYDGTLMGSLNVMKTYIDYFSITTPLKGLLSSATSIGGGVSCLFTAPLVDRIGRKKGMLLSAIICLIGAALQGAAQNTAMFIISRIIIGIGTGISGVAAPTYVAETAPYKWRAFALGLYFTCWNVGGMVASGVCYATENMNSTWAWRIPSLLQALTAIMCMCILPFVPESPRWLVYQDRREEALEILAIAHADGDQSNIIVQTEFLEITDTLNYEKSVGKGLSYKEALGTPANRRRVMLGISVAVVTILPGSAIITNYFGTMLDQAGISDAKTQLEINIILSAFSLVLAVAGCFLAERLGRRMLCMGSLAGCAISFFLFGGLLSKYFNTTDKSAIYGTIACMFLFQGVYSFGLTPLTVIYPPEVLSYSIRASGMAITTLSFKLFTVFAAYVWPFALQAITWKSYMINAAFDVLLVIWVYFTWVETKSKTLEEIDVFFDGEKHTDALDVGEIAQAQGSKDLAQA
ncbi:general substrate transporter-1 [Coleophoma cylindrospora]|uniref:General substrate transporter-1 n=1 Tax=Coleophoma cylindrospora TaxID=1849047 RepID=A0A3D8Q4A6_9HELO|nr:general substrate transporter-1 [Coleophoma cylindrospora]